MVYNMVCHVSLKEVNYYYITDERMKLSATEQATKAVDSEVKMIQYRRKNGSTKDIYTEAVRVKRVCDGKAIFIVNDRVDIALAVEADGVHIGQRDLPADTARRLMDDKILGISTHNMKQASKAQEIADYVGIGPVHNTRTKERDDKVLGVQCVLDIAKRVTVPTVAIGGIDEKDLKALAEGVDMVCAISSVCQEGNLSERIKMFEKIFHEKKTRWRT